MDKEIKFSFIKGLNVARLAMHGRILRCPFEDNPKDCPFYEIRLLPIPKRIDWLDSKSNDEVVGLYKSHAQCWVDKTKNEHVASCVSYSVD